MTAVEGGETRGVRRLLLAEDNAADVFLMEAALQHAGVALEFVVARDGVEALAVLQEGGDLPDAVVLDLNMPRMNGFEVLEAVRSDPRLAGLQVIVLTTSSASVDRERAQALGADAYITKPLAFDEFTALAGRLDELVQPPVPQPG